MHDYDWAASTCTLFLIRWWRLRSVSLRVMAAAWTSRRATRRGAATPRPKSATIVPMTASTTQKQPGQCGRKGCCCGKASLWQGARPSNPIIRLEDVACIATAHSGCNPLRSRPRASLQARVERNAGAAVMATQRLTPFIPQCTYI